MSRLDEIQARVDAATPGPWVTAYYAGHAEPCDRHDGAAHVSYVSGPEDAWVLWDGYVGEDAIVAIMPADLALLTAAPDDVRWLLARVRALEAGMAKYGRHKPMCNVGFPEGTVPFRRGCNCGLQALAGES